MFKKSDHQFCLMSFNILYGGTHLGQPLEQTAAVISLLQPDIVVVCEQFENAKPLANLLGFTCYIVAAPPYWQSVAVLSRYPILETFANGVRLGLNSRQSAQHESMLASKRWTLCQSKKAGPAPRAATRIIEKASK